MRIKVVLSLFALSTGLAFADEKIPEAVTTASQSVFRIIFLRPKAEVVEIPLDAYEKEVEKAFPASSFMSWWVHTVGDHCRKAKKEKCPIQFDLRIKGGKWLIPEGSTSLVGDGRTLYTAPHVWVPYYDFARSLGASEQSNKEIQKAAKETFIDREIDFILFDEKRNIVLNTHDDKPAKIRDYAVGSLIPYLYPKLDIGVTIDHLEFMVMELATPLPEKYKPIRRAVDITDKNNPNGLAKSLAYGTTFYPVGMPDDGEVNLEAKKLNGEYRDLHVARGKTTRALINALDSSPFVEKELVTKLERVHFGIDAKVYHGMSGGPILNAKGELVSLNSTNQPVPTSTKIGPDGTFPRTQVIIGPHPAVLP